MRHVQWISWTISMTQIFQFAVGYFPELPEMFPFRFPELAAEDEILENLDEFSEHLGTLAAFRNARDQRRSFVVKLVVSGCLWFS